MIKIQSNFWDSHNKVLLLLKNSMLKIEANLQYWFLITTQNNYKTATNTTKSKMIMHTDNNICTKDIEEKLDI